MILAPIKYQLAYFCIYPENYNWLEWDWEIYGWTSWHNGVI